jgi:hypothetical protein
MNDRLRKKIKKKSGERMRGKKSTIRRQKNHNFPCAFTVFLPAFYPERELQGKNCPYLAFMLP